MRDNSGRCGTCGSYLKSILKFLVSHIGLVSLVVGYTIIGAFTFAKLEAEHEVQVKKNMSTVREKVTDKLWDITNEMRVLERFEWSDRARVTLKTFEKSLIKAIKQDGWDGIEANEPKQWTFAGALFYSIILITTIGYGHIAPKTPWGKVVTIFYAIPGVPLMMLCLANIGDGMAHSFRFLYWKVCCYACTKRPKRKRRPKTPSRISRSSHHSGGSHAPPARTSSFRRSARTSQRSADSQYSDSAFYSYSDHDYRLPAENGVGDLGDGPPHRGRGGPAHRGTDDVIGPRGSGRSAGGRASDRSSSSHPHPTPHSGGDSHSSSKRSGDPREDEGRAAVLFTNKYAVEGGGDVVPDGDAGVPAPNRASDRSNASNRALNYPGGRGRGGGELGDQPPRRALSHSPTGTPPMGAGGRGRHYPQHLTPPHGGLMPPHRGMVDSPPYLDESDEYEDDPEGDMGDPGDKPVPIWLGVMLVVVYILGGAVLFSGWENWEFLDSVYFCFITLTTIGFGDFVPAQETKDNAELSIVLCSLYLLFGIALLAMSFNLVQEEVISNVKSVAKRLGIIKEEEGDQLQD